MNALASSALGRTFFALSIFCMAIAIILLGKPLLAPLSLSFILAFVLTPVVRRLETIGLGRLTSVLLIVISLTLALIVLGSQLVSQLNALVTELPQHKQEIEAKLASFRTGPNTAFSEIIDLSKQVLGNFESLGDSQGATDIQRVAIVDEKSPIPCGMEQLARRDGAHDRSRECVVRDRRGLRTQSGVRAHRQCESGLLRR